MVIVKASPARRTVLAETNGRIKRRLLPLVMVVAVACPWVGLWDRRCIGGLRWYQPVYRLFYRLGLIIWRRARPPAELVALVEGPSALPIGRALDLGCGTGTDTIYLAARGWDVTGVDMVPKALAIARRSATAAGVSPLFLQGDVTRLDELGVGDGYTLLLDFGCFHTLPASPTSPPPARRFCYTASAGPPKPRPCTPA